MRVVPLLVAFLAALAALASAVAPAPFVMTEADRAIGPMREPDSFTMLTKYVDELHADPEFGPALTKMSCKTCTGVVSAFAKASQSETTMAWIIEMAGKGCDKIFPHDAEKDAACRSISSAVLSLLPKATEALIKLDWEPEAFCSFIVPACTIDCCVHKSAPEQVHLALTDSPSEMAVSWVSLTASGPALVHYWPAADAPSTAKTVEAVTEPSYLPYWNGNNNHGVMTGLTSETAYSYQVESNGVRSEVFGFRTLSDLSVLGTRAAPLRIAQIADMDYSSAGAAVTKAMIEFAANNTYDVILFVGDIGYADGYEKHWDVFMRTIEPFAARTPVMVVPGNHELLHAFGAYKARFYMPRRAETENMFYSIALGTAHITMMSSESPINTPKVDKDMLALFHAEHATPAARDATWRIVAFHRPMYCTTHASKAQCGPFAALLRAVMEKPLKDAKVDVHISGHQHGYERTWPVYQGKVVAKHYENPGAPMYFVSGAAGNREGMREVFNDQPWSATGSVEPGYLDIVIADNMAKFDYIHAESGEVFDSAVLVK